MYSLDSINDIGQTKNASISLKHNSAVLITSRVIARLKIEKIGETGGSLAISTEPPLLLTQRLIVLPNSPEKDSVVQLGHRPILPYLAPDAATELTSYTCRSRSVSLRLLRHAYASRGVAQRHQA